MLTDAGIQTVVDVRQFPGSERAPLFTAARFAPALAAAGIGYVHLAGLSGRRHPDPASPHVALRIPALRAFADQMTTDAFLADYARLREIATGSPTAILCSERLWWRCHRRLIADRLTMDGWTVTHLLTPKKQDPHRVLGAARLVDKGLIYDQAGTTDADDPTAGESLTEGPD